MKDFLKTEASEYIHYLEEENYILKKRSENICQPNINDYLNEIVHLLKEIAYHVRAK